MSTTTDFVIGDLEWVIAYWPDLVEARLPMSTPRPWRQPQLSPEAKARRDFEARIDWAFRNPLALGTSPAPVDVAVLQTALDILVDADDLAAAIAPEVMCPVLPPPGPGQLDARPYLAFVVANLAAAPHMVDGVASVARSMYDRAARALGMAYDGQALTVICPWCGGRTPETPAGGAPTWRVMVLPGDQVAIVCTGQCEPPLDQVGTWWLGQPCWPLAQWGWLAKHVMSAEEQAARTRDRIAS